MRQLIFIHGRAQEHKDSKALKQEWLDALGEGLAKSGLTLPLGDADVRFPYYGDTLFDLVAGRSASEAAAVVVRGTEADQDEQRFVRAVLEEVRQRAGITEAQMVEVAGTDVVQRGPAELGMGAGRVARGGSIRAAWQRCRHRAGDTRRVSIPEQCRRSVSRSTTASRRR